MKRAVLVLLVFGMFGTCAETLAAQCFPSIFQKSLSYLCTIPRG
jgi:hypothetical protein